MSTIDELIKAFKEKAAKEETNEVGRHKLNSGTAMSKLFDILASREGDDNFLFAADQQEDGKGDFQVLCHCTPHFIANVITSLWREVPKSMKVKTLLAMMEGDMKGVKSSSGDDGLLDSLINLFKD